MWDYNGMSDYQPVNSSFIQGAQYNPETKTMRVKFASGKEYVYEGVPSDTYGEFEKTFQTKDSSGKFLNSRLKKYAKS